MVATLDLCKLLTPRLLDVTLIDTADAQPLEDTTGPSRRMRRKVRRDGFSG